MRGCDYQEEIKDEQRSNDLFSFSSFSHSNDFSNIRINKHIDCFTLSIYRKKEKTIMEFLLWIGFEMKKQFKLEDKQYGMISKYENQDDTAKIDILHDLKKQKPGMPTAFITVHDPHEEIICLLNWLFQYLGIIVKLSEIELTFDWYADDIDGLKAFLEMHTLLRHQRTPSYFDEGTFYFNDRDDSERWLKLYPKENDTGEFVRLELTVKRPALRKFSLEFPFPNIESIDMLRYFTFVKFKRDWLYRHFMKQASLDGKYGSLRHSIVRSWIEHGLINQESFMKAVEVMKWDEGYQNHDRMYREYKELKDKFRKEVSRQTFIKSRRS